MRLSSLMLCAEGEDAIEARHVPARTVRYEDGNEFAATELLHVHIGDVLLYGPPAVVVELLGRAMNQARAAWAERGRTFEAEVRRMRARLLSVTAFLDGEEAA